MSRSSIRPAAAGRLDAVLRAGLQLQLVYPEEEACSEFLRVNAFNKNQRHRIGREMDELGEHRGKSEALDALLNAYDTESVSSIDEASVVVERLNDLATAALGGFKDSDGRVFELLKEVVKQLEQLSISMHVFDEPAFPD